MLVFWCSGSESMLENHIFQQQHSIKMQLLCHLSREASCLSQCLLGLTPPPLGILRFYNLRLVHFQPPLCLLTWKIWCASGVTTQSRKCHGSNQERKKQLESFSSAASFARCYINNASGLNRLKEALSRSWEVILMFCYCRNILEMYLIMKNELYNQPLTASTWRIVEQKSAYK